MISVKFGTKEFEAPWVETSNDMVNGFMRQCITVHLSADAEGLDTINTILSDATNTNTIVVANDETGIAGSVATQIFEGYTIKRKVAMEQFASLDSQGNQAYEDRIVIVLARKTAQEIQVEAMFAAMQKAKLI